MSESSAEVLAWIGSLEGLHDQTESLVVAGEDRLSGAPPVQAVDLSELPSHGDRYREGPELGRGGIGEVALAEDVVLHRAVAVKRLLSASPSPEQLQRFLLEARVTGRLDHPNIVDVHDLGIDAEGRPYFTMPFVRGNQSLRRLIQQLQAGDPETKASFSYQRRAQLVQDLCQALAYAHEQGVLHRDLKPENVMLASFGQVLLMDWGLAKLEGREPPESAPSPAAAPQPAAPPDPSRLPGLEKPFESNPDVLRGTPGYMAPEQFLGQPASPASDTYALSAVLYELLTLEHPLQPALDRKVSVVRAALEHTPRPADDFFDPELGRVPRTLAKVCEAGLAKNPADRLQTPRELHQRLQSWLEGDVPAVCPTTFSMSLLQRWQKGLNDYPGPATFLTFLTVGLALLGIVLLSVLVVGALLA